MLAIVDTGCANLASVGFAFERLGVGKIITQDAKIIASADHVILPGVGAFDFAMAALRERGLVQVLQNLTQPLMGICLGMQMLFDRSEEGVADGLGLITGNIERMDTGNLPAPHMGWNTLEDMAEDPLLAGINAGDYVYFVHSFAVPVQEETIASSTYGQIFSAVIRRGNIYGCQFHPERSGKTGARILANFLKVKP
ncbi:MAG: imidazole glycerol phosphate synthase subunit HisH [Robiginitomaculum sp.]|nr:MAG: imidazole glycerol phosphate synthase subunit HisH [Robiginitomaculum sp.]